MIRHPKDRSRPVILTLTDKQIYTILRALNELDIVLEQQYCYLYPSQKREIKVASKHLRKFKCWKVLETALAGAQGDLT